MKRFYNVSNYQIITNACLISILTTSLVAINNSIQEYFQLPLVIMSEDGKCAQVMNVKNGEAYTCNDVGMILRNYRTKKN